MNTTMNSSVSPEDCHVYAQYEMGYGSARKDLLSLDKELVQNHTNIALASAVLRCLLLVLSIMGNSVVISTVLYFRELHVTANWFLVNLASANLFTAILTQTWFAVSMFLALAEYSRPCTSHFRFVLDLLGMVAVNVSIGSLFLVTMDRYIAVSHSLRYATILSEKRVAFLISFSWIFSVALSSFRTFLPSMKSVIAFSWFLFLIVITFIMTFIDLKLLCISKTQSSKIVNQTKLLNPNALCKKERRGLATAACITAALLICYVPHTCVEILYQNSNLLENISTLRLVYQATISLYLSNASLNPYLYFLRSKRLRRYSLKLVKKFRNR